VQLVLIGQLLKTDLRHRDISIATVLKSAEDKLADFDRVEKEKNPIMTCFGAPGTGKSRLAEEVGKSFRDIGTRHDKENYPNLAKLANDVLCIHLSFNSNTKIEEDETNVQGALSRRLISSAFDLDFDSSSRFRGMKFRDSLKLVLHFHRLHHAPDAPRTLVYVAIDDIGGVYSLFKKDGLKALTDAVGKCLIDPPAGMLFVSLVTGTIREPVRDVLTESSHPREEVGVPLFPLDDNDDDNNDDNTDDDNNDDDNNDDDNNDDDNDDDDNDDDGNDDDYDNDNNDDNDDDDNDDDYDDGNDEMVVQKTK